MIHLIRCPKCNHNVAIVEDEKFDLTTKPTVNVVCQDCRYTFTLVFDHQLRFNTTEKKTFIRNGNRSYQYDESWGFSY